MAARKPKLIPEDQAEKLEEKPAQASQLTEHQKAFMARVLEVSLECVPLVKEDSKIVLECTVDGESKGIVRNMGYAEIIRRYETSLKRLKKNAADDKKKNENVKLLMKRAIEMRKKAAAKKPSAK